MSAVKTINRMSTVKKETLDLAVIHVRVADAKLAAKSNRGHVEHFDPGFPAEASPLTHLLRARRLIDFEIKRLKTPFIPPPK